MRNFLPAVDAKKKKKKKKTNSLPFLEIKATYFRIHVFVSYSKFRIFKVT